MKNKICWIDTETTGVTSKHGVIQISSLMEDNYKIIDNLNLFIQPLKNDLIDDEALAVHGYSREDIANFTEAPSAMVLFQSYLSRYVNKFDKKDKLILAGYNINFDKDRVRDFFTKQGDKFFGSWFFWPTIDVTSLLAEYMVHSGVQLENYKLGTVCKHFGIEINAHDALSDIIATRDLYKLLRNEITNYVVWDNPMQQERRPNL
jgi:DNA polymerase III subunit epsilon